MVKIKVSILPHKISSVFWLCVKEQFAFSRLQPLLSVQTFKFFDRDPAGRRRRGGGVGDAQNWNYSIQKGGKEKSQRRNCSPDTLHQSLKKYIVL